MFNLLTAFIRYDRCDMHASDDWAYEYITCIQVKVSDPVEELLLR